MSATVFVLGAGFSVPGEMPVQADIMRSIVTRASQGKVRGTIEGLFSIFQVEDMVGVPMEDIFTMLDRARNAKETLIGFTHDQLEESYKTFMHAITAEFERRLTRFEGAHYRFFITELLQRLVRAREETATPFSLVTLNWDTIPDFMIKKEGTAYDLDIDYGCFSWNIDNQQDQKTKDASPGNRPLEVKLLKLHGSLNWLVCTSCGRLFSCNSQSDYPPVLHPYTHRCRFCQETKLENLIITPTLVKNLNQTHLNLIWHNALLEMQAAGRIVFIGYSFPLADFEFRYLLLKAITGRPKVRIRVILYPPDELISEERERIQRHEVESRYRTFFGARDLEFKFMDATKFMSDPFLIWQW